MNEVGFAWFSQPKSAKGGWCLIGNDFVSFQSIGELDNSIVWLTNIPNAEYKKQGLWHYQHLRDDQYIRVSVNQIIKELGIRTNDMKSLEKLMRVMVNVATTIGELFDISHRDARYKLVHEIRGKVVPEELDATPTGVNLTEIRTVFEDATQSNQGCKKGVTKGLKLHNFVVPRAQYSSYILNQTFPISNHWECTELFDTPIRVGSKAGKELPNTESVRNTLIQLHKSNALFLQVKVRSIEQKYEHGFTFGSEGAFASFREWAALPEILRMLDYSEVELHKAYITKSGLLSNRPAIEPERVNLSYTRGLVAENIMLGMAERQTISSNTKAHTALGAYIRAYDRLMCSKYAEQFLNKGFPLAGFGVGYVRLWLSQHTVKEANELALELGLLPQFGAQ